MVKDPKLVLFLEAQETVSENLDAIKAILGRCVDEGMLDPDCTYYNEILLLSDQTILCKSFDELMEVVFKAKILETDIAAWLASKGRTSVSLPWPSPPNYS